MTLNIGPVNTGKLVRLESRKCFSCGLFLGEINGDPGCGQRAKGIGPDITGNHGLYAKCGNILTGLNTGALSGH